MRRHLKTPSLAALFLGAVIYHTTAAGPATDAGYASETLPATEVVKYVETATVEGARTNREARFLTVTRAARRARLGFFSGGPRRRRGVDRGRRT